MAVREVVRPTAAPTPRSRRRGRWWLVAGGTAVGAAVVVALLVTSARPADLPDVPGVIEHASPWWLLAALVLLVAGNVARAHRLRALLDDRLRRPDAFSITCSYNFFTAVVPAGLGELALPLRLARRHGCPRADAASALLLTRLLDLLGLLTAALLGALVTPGLGAARGPVAGLSLAALAVTGLLTWRLASVAAWLGRRRSGPPPGSGRPGLVRSVTDPLLAVAVSLAAQRRRVDRVVLGDTALMWAAVWLAIVAQVRAVHQPLPLAAGGLAIAAVFLLTALPVPALAGIGLQDAGWVLALTSFAGLDRSVAVGSALALHALTLALLALVWLIGALVGRFGAAFPWRAAA